MATSEDSEASGLTVSTPEGYPRLNDKMRNLRSFPICSPVAGFVTPALAAFLGCHKVADTVLGLLVRTHFHGHWLSCGFDGWWGMNACNACIYRLSMSSRTPRHIVTAFTPPFAHRCSFHNSNHFSDSRSSIALIFWVATWQLGNQFGTMSECVAAVSTWFCDACVSCVFV